MQNDSFFSLLRISFSVRLFNLKEFFKTLWLYYRSPRFFALDMTLLLHYFFKSPYRICEEEAEKQGVDSLTPYGETPFTVLDTIAKECGIQKSDRVLELGCGRGRSCFWLSHFIGCKTKGIDLIPIFIQRAEKIRRWFSIENVEFLCEDLSRAHVEGATYLYLYALTLDDKEIRALVERIQTCKNLYIISISFSLKEYMNVKEIKQFDVPFPWGKGTVYLSRKEA